MVEPVPSTWEALVPPWHCKNEQMKEERMTAEDQGQAAAITAPARFPGPALPPQGQTSCLES